MSSSNKNRFDYYDESIKALQGHARISNEEMGVVKEHMGVIEKDVAILKNDIKWIVEKLEKVDVRTWAILGTIVLGILLNITALLWKR